MTAYNYRESICEDIRCYIVNNIRVRDFEDRAELEEHLNDELWTEDSVTGNASGSYTFSTWQAEENLCHNLDLLSDALSELGGDLRVLENPEAADVTIRCYLLSECIATVLDELEDGQWTDE